MNKNTQHYQNVVQQTIISEVLTNRGIFWPTYFGVAMVGLLSAYIICSVHFGYYIDFGNTFDYYSEPVETRDSYIDEKLIEHEISPNVDEIENKFDYSHYNVIKGQDLPDEKVNEIIESSKNDELSESSLVNTTKEFTSTNSTEESFDFSDAQIMVSEYKLNMAKVNNQYNRIDQNITKIDEKQDNMLKDILEIKNDTKIHTEKFVRFESLLEQMSAKIDRFLAVKELISANHAEILANQEEILANHKNILAEQAEYSANQADILANQEEILANNNNILAKQERVLADLLNNSVKQDRILAGQERFLKKKK